MRRSHPRSVRAATRSTRQSSRHSRRRTPTAGGPGSLPPPVLDTGCSICGPRTRRSSSKWASTRRASRTHASAPPATSTRSSRTGKATAGDLRPSPRSRRRPARQPRPVSRLGHFVYCARETKAMNDSLRVVHYVNQFFAGLGGEEAANLPVEVRSEPVGATRALVAALGGQATVVGMIVAGDNYMNDERETARVAVRELLRDLRPHVVVAGPAFEAGRYGIACAEICRVAA